jgi:hypothetical protein
MLWSAFSLEPSEFQQLLRSTGKPADLGFMWHRLSGGSSRGMLTANGPGSASVGGVIARHKIGFKKSLDTSCG